MDLRNWEFYDNGNALVGASVVVRDAILSHPNAGTILASTSTDSNGAWSFTGLTDTAKDVEVIWGNVSQYHKWYKGMTRHDTGKLVFTEAVNVTTGGLTVTAGGLTVTAGGLTVTAGTVSLPAGEIGTTEIAADAVTLSTTPMNFSGSTTSPTWVQVGSTINVTGSGGKHFLIWTGAVTSSVSALTQLIYRLDGGADNYIHYETMAAPGTRGGEWSLGALSGAHDIKIYAQTTGGTFTMSPASAFVREYKR
jgi:hypothetical protein